MAERERFELSRPLRAYGISSAAPSTELGDRSGITVSNRALSALQPANRRPSTSPRGRIDAAAGRMMSWRSSCDTVVAWRMYPRVTCVITQLKSCVGLRPESDFGSA